jgi:drug/metabolite transporter (DMT)-like permease
LAGTGFAVRAPLRIHRPGLPLVALCGGMDMGSNILFIVAVHTGALSVVAVISSLYPAATVALAAALLHERLGAVQWSGVVLALVGVACIALAR